MDIMRQKKINKITSFLFLLLMIFFNTGCKDFNKNSSCNKKRLDGKVFYEIFVQSFYDSDNDGIGDINGVIAKLDYLEELGVDGIWLMPVHPSPTYHKYDVTDYYGIHKDYGTLDDYKKFVKEAHKRNMMVLLDLVVNHTSSCHPWFKEATKNKKNQYLDYYVWSSDTTVINNNPHQWHQVKDSNGDSLCEEKYFGFFWHEMPDLNFDNPDVREEIKKIGRYWLKEIGVDGFRLDAIRFIYPENEKEKNYQWWQEFRKSMEEINPDFFMVGEVWGEDTVIAPFLDKGVHAGFNFELSFAIEKNLISEKKGDIIEKLMKSKRAYEKYSDCYFDAIFLKNHDQNRIASILKNEEKAKLAVTILLTLPGIPFIYYGEEIGMLGKKPDKYIREPMIWQIDSLDSGRTRWMNPVYSTDSTIISVENQLSDLGSILNHYKKLIHLRKNNEILKFGELSPFDVPGKSVLAYKREYSGQELIVIHNLSKTTISIDLKNYSLLKNNILFSSSENNRISSDKVEIYPYSTLILN